MSKLREAAKIAYGAWSRGEGGAYVARLDDMLDRAITALEKIETGEQHPKCEGQRWQCSVDCSCAVLFARDALELRDV